MSNERFTREQMEEAWLRLGAGVDDESMSGLRPTTETDVDAYVAVDISGNRHLLIAVPEDVEPIVGPGASGLTAAVKELVIAERPSRMFIDLECDEAKHNPTFSAFAADLLCVLSEASSPPRAVVLDVMRRWRAFWRSNRSSLSRDDALGLFGELWFLLRWALVHDAHVMQGWTGSSGSRHDMQWPGASVEVKTSASSSSDWPVHTISNLEQLAPPERGELFLFSLLVADERLAENSLRSVVSELVARFSGDGEAIAVLNDSLAARGYDPGDSERLDRTLKVRAERLFHVTGDFPRLTRERLGSLLPVGIPDLSYKLDTAVCEPWKVASSPDDEPACALLKIVSETSPTRGDSSQGPVPGS